MMQYSENEKQRLLSFPLEGVLAAFGKRTDHKGYMYYSPFREESAPSFHIDARTNRWYDFGSAEGGGLVDLVCHLKSCPRSEVFDVIASLDANFIHVDSPKIEAANTPSRGLASAVRIENVSDSISRYSLIEYALGQRRIPLEILDRYCKEISYRIVDRPGSLYYAIGFPNNAGGWVLRSTRTKICSSSDITTLDRSGRLSDIPSSRRALVFEGFFDMLSWRVLFGCRSLGCDVCVLNSVANWKRAEGWLASHGKVCLCLDNDDAGRRTASALAASIKQANSKAEVWDMSPSFASYKDVGEKLQEEGASRNKARNIR